MTKPETVIVDFDNTICDTSSIWHLAEEGLKTKNFDKFHEASRDCPPIPTTIEDMATARKQGYVVVVVTARQEEYRHITIEWMRKNKVVCDGLLMRQTGDHRPDTIIKYEILQQLRRFSTVIHAWEDNPEVVELWRREGIPVTVVRL